MCSCSETSAKVVKDPVCAMQVDPARAAGQTQYQGQSYSYCSLGCKKKFDRDLTLYVQSGTPDAETQLATDPVCRMKISPQSAAGLIEHTGRTWYFCGQSCLTK
jgi:Cu+-exporting ATPase